MADEEEVGAVEVPLVGNAIGNEVPIVGNGIGNIVLRDHETLETPSCRIDFQGKQSHILNTGNSQIVLESQKNSNVLKVKQFDEATPGLLLLRFAYTLMAVLMAGFLFVFCVQLILFLFLGLAIESGLTSKQNGFNFGVFFGTLLAIPSFLFGLSNAMTIAMAFIADTWNGQKLMKTVIKWDSVLVDWLSCVVFMLVPLFTAGISLASGSKDWWEHATIAWFVCIFLYYLLFAAVTIYFEVDGCFELMRYHGKVRSTYDSSTSKFNLKTATESIMMKQKSLLSGFKIANYIANSSEPQTIETDWRVVEEKDRFVATFGLLSRITVVFAKSGIFYKMLDTPERKYTIDEARGYAPFVTSHSWGLEKMYCRNRQSNLVAVVDGKSAMTRNQVRSSFICYFLGFVTTLFLIAAFLAWFESSPAFIGVICGLYILYVFSSAKNAWAMKHIYGELKKKDKTNQTSTLGQVRAPFRINEANDRFCWIMFILEFIFGYVLPMITLFAAGNYPVGIVFGVTATITGCRRFFSSVVILQELGSLDGMELNNTIFDEDNDGELKAEEEWREKHRLGQIISEISSGVKRKFWMSLYAFFIVIFCAIFMSAVALGSNAGKTIGQDMSDNHEYLGSGDLQYSSCQLGQGIVTPAGLENSLVDFTFLANVAYEDPNSTEVSLGKWFRADEDVSAGDALTDGVIDHQNIVDDFKTEYEAENGESAVTYKFIGFPGESGRNLGVVTIRGTSNSWDALTDAQLWSSAALAQYVRAILPLGVKRVLVFL